jgi:hypothetical protein
VGRQVALSIGFRVLAADSSRSEGSNYQRACGEEAEKKLNCINQMPSTMAISLWCSLGASNPSGEGSLSSSTLASGSSAPTSPLLGGAWACGGGRTEHTGHQMRTPSIDIDQMQNVKLDASLSICTRAKLGGRLIWCERRDGQRLHFVIADYTL